MVNLDDITEEEGNYVEYQTAPSLTWHPAHLSKEVVEHLMNTQFGQWKSRVQTTDCMAELRRLLDAGPPIYISDKHALPVPEGDTHVCKLWFAEEDEERPAVLKDAVLGEERDKLWEEFRAYYVPGRDQPEEEEEDAAGAAAGSE